MIVNAKMILVSVEKKESNGKIYCNANMECVEDGTVSRLGCDVEVANCLTEKYKPYDCFFNVGVSRENGMYMRLVQASPAK